MISEPVYRTVDRICRDVFLPEDRNGSSPATSSAAPDIGRHSVLRAAACHKEGAAEHFAVLCVSTPVRRARAGCGR